MDLDHHLAPETLKHYQKLLASLQPSARAWIEEQAKIEASRPALDVPALKGAILQRFGGSAPGTTAQQPNAWQLTSAPPPRYL